MPRAPVRIPPDRLARSSLVAALALAAVLATSVFLALEDQPWPWMTWVLFALLADLGIVAFLLSLGLEARPRRRAGGAFVLLAAAFAGVWFFGFALSGGDDRAAIGSALGVLATAALTLGGLVLVLDPVERRLAPLPRP